MTSLSLEVLLGLIAALAWGVHDILIRYVSRTIGILQSLTLVLVFGALAWLMLGLTLGNIESMTGYSAMLSLASGIAFSVGSVCHYNAFAKGPIRLVAPIISAYSLVSFIIAVILGHTVILWEWLAVLALIAGIGLIVRPSNTHDAQTQTYNFKTLMGWCFMAVISFALTFALGQEANAYGDPIWASLLTRITTLTIIAILWFIVKSAQNGNITRLSYQQIGLLALMGMLDAAAISAVLYAGILPAAQYASAASSSFGLVTILLAWCFFKETINRTQWIGVVIIFASLAYLAAH